MIIVKKPKIRFKGFTETWEQRKLEEICESFEYGLNAAAKEYDGENKYIRITDIDDNSHEFIQDDVTSPDIDLTNSENYQLKYGDVIFTRTGASVGKTYIYKESDGLVYYAGFLIRGRVKSNYSPEFIFQNTLTDDYDKFIRITSQRSGQPGVNAQEYASYEISVPKFEEQQKIGAYFSTLDHLITLHQRQCENLKKLKKFMLQKLFPQNGENVPEIRFSNFTDTWEQRKLNEICNYHSSSLTAKDSCTDGEYDLFDVNSLIGKTSSSCIDENYITIIKDGAGVGRTRLLPKNTMFLGTMGALTPKGIDLNFLFQIVSKAELGRFCTGSTIPHIYFRDYGENLFFVPSNREQKPIGDYFSKLDNLITLHQSKCDKLIEVKKYMLQNMFI